ncbi:MAG TPA: endonuclease/exonuclease/phosphatase family protein [Bacteroidales bacterium]|nr:endonuclease/exonuclease/phosphatase family protein [Bacteroidales bacterium]
MYTIKKFLKAIIYIIISLWVVFFGIIIYGVISDYKPDEKILIEENKTPDIITDSSDISVLTWNIGYCGLDADMDFFYDGGTKVRTSRDSFNRNFSAISDFIRSNDSIDFIFLQEVDRKSKRSYRTDEFAAIKDHLESTSAQFATNYDVFFVPVPATNPMGKVLSGISILGKRHPASSVRYAFPGEYGFPKQLFMLDRCFLVNRYPLKNGRELVLINTHNEAFDPGEIRKAQMDYLKTFLLDEYGKGNYIIVGGDWNQAPPDFEPEFSGDVVNTNQMVLKSDYLPGEWTWAYDNTIPSNRSVTVPYNPAVTATTVIDFFLLSPNVKSINVRCIDLRFKNSDHNPVIIRAGLR